MRIHYGSHNENIGYLANLSHLNIKGDTGKLNPASVTADFFTEGDQ